MSETDVVRDAMKQLPLRYPGSRWVRINAGSKGRIKFTSEPMLDLAGVQKFGMAAVCECKTATGKLEPHQYACLLDMGRRGALAILYTPEGIFHWEDIPQKHMPAKPRAK